MFSSIQGFGQQAFISLVTIAVIIITGYIIRPGRLKPIETVTIASLLIIIGIQYYNLVLVVTYLPASQHWVYDVSFYQFYRHRMIILAYAYIHRVLQRGKCASIATKVSITVYYRFLLTKFDNQEGNGLLDHIWTMILIHVFAKLHLRAVTQSIQVMTRLQFKIIFITCLPLLVKGIRIHGACPTDGSAYCMEDASNTTEVRCDA